MREIQKAQRHIEDRYPESNLAGQKYNVAATVTALRVAHSNLSTYINSISDNTQGEARR